MDDHTWYEEDEEEETAVYFCLHWRSCWQGGRGNRSDHSGDDNAFTELLVIALRSSYMCSRFSIVRCVVLYWKFVHFGIRGTRYILPRLLVVARSSPARTFLNLTTSLQCFALNWCYEGTWVWGIGRTAVDHNWTQARERPSCGQETLSSSQ